MKAYTLNIGDVVSHRGSAQYTCFGLGSCIGLFLHDPSIGITGGAHILLPGNEKGPDTSGWYSVHEALQELMNRFRAHGSSLTKVHAKLAGGASVVGNLGVGMRNIDSIVSELSSHDIFIAGFDVGGNQSRTVQFESATGKLTIRKAGDTHPTIL